MRVSDWMLVSGGRGAGVRCIQDKERGSCTVSGARIPSRGRGGNDVPFGTTARKPKTW